MPLPQNLGRLTLLHHLGSDTYTVWSLYHDPDRGTPVVVRALSDQWTHHPQARADFLAGAGPFQSVSSPQHVALLSAGEAPDGTPYVLMPYAAPTGAPPPGGGGAAPFSPPAWVPPKQTRRRWPVVAAIVVVVLALATAGIVALAVGTNGGSGSAGPAVPVPLQPSGQASQPSSPATPGAPSGARPQVGQCRNLTDAAVPRPSDSTPVVDCSQSHTAQTYYVGRYRSGSTPDNTYAGAVCRKQLGHGLGVSDKAAALTAYQVVFFGPDSAAWAAGARWFRCDVALMAGNHLLPLPNPLVPSPLPSSLQACLTRQGALTPCDHSHLLRAVATFTVTGSTPPSAKQTQAQGRAACPAGSAIFTGPSAAEFRQGLRVGVCWAAEGQVGSPT